jgi:hypothetical protein
MAAGAAQQFDPVKRATKYGHSSPGRSAGRNDTFPALGIDSVEFPDTFVAAETEWVGAAGNFDVTIETLPEYDGECT